MLMENCKICRQYFSKLNFMQNLPQKYFEKLTGLDIPPKYQLACFFSKGYALNVLNDKPRSNRELHQGSLKVKKTLHAQETY